MSQPEPRSISDDATRLIGQLGDAEGSAARRLLPLVYKELRALAQSYFDHQRPDHTLQPTAVVHEAFVRLVGNTQIAWEGRSHFLAVAAKAMRNVLADHARRKWSAKRGGDWERITLSDIGSSGSNHSFDVCNLDGALEDLETLNERHARIVELRFFGGLTVPQVGLVLDVTERTVRREWRLARAWLRERLAEGETA